MMRIGVTDTLGSEHKFQRYLSWLQSCGGPVTTATLSHKRLNITELERCDGLVLTGGHDVDPALYGGPLHHPAIVETDRERDDFERQALQRALEIGLPVLGICRGLQLANVFFGGTLVPDLEEKGFRPHRSAQEGIDCQHQVHVEHESLLYNITGARTGTVNSSHHQAAEQPGEGLRATARSDDGVIEALERHGGNSSPFFLLVQWHPERMGQAGDPFARNILKGFLSSMKTFKK